RLKHLLPDAELVEEIKRLDGTPPELLENPEVVEMILRLFRADLTVVETYPYAERPPLGCPITAFGGVDDEDVLREELEEWEAHTSSRFRLQMMAGHHFYLYEARSQLLQAVRRDLSLAAQRWTAHV
ncbi:MAG: thioesterase II family protein, partial [Pyrinomonadaceae bacterium]